MRSGSFHATPRLFEILQHLFTHKLGEIRKIAVQHGMVTLQGDAILKVQMGLTTPEEVLRAVWMEGD